MCRYLIAEGASLHIYDPKVTSERIFLDLTEQTNLTENECRIDPFSPSNSTSRFRLVRKTVKIADEPYQAAKDSHAIVVCTEWDEFTVSYRC